MTMSAWIFAGAQRCQAPHVDLLDRAEVVESCRTLLEAKDRNYIVQTAAYADPGVPVQPRSAHTVRRQTMAEANDVDQLLDQLLKGKSSPRLPPRHAPLAAFCATSVIASSQTRRMMALPG